MPLRTIEIRLPIADRQRATELIGHHETIDAWTTLSDEVDVHHILIDSHEVEKLVDDLRGRFGEHNRILISSVEATLPRVPEDPEPTPAVPSKRSKYSRVSREELYEDVGEGIALNPVFLLLAGVSAVVACVGLVQDDTIALIGAMVIAPLLGPNVGLALATTLADFQLGKRALKAGGAGIAVSFLVALVYGFLFEVPDTMAIADRIAPDIFTIVLALASGVAGGLAFTTGAPASLIGVMVAVALLPPLATGGLLLGDGQVSRSTGAFILLGVNLVAVNLAGVATFLLQGIRPLWRSDKEKARRSAVRALALWTLLLAAFGAGVWWLQH